MGRFYEMADYRKAPLFQEFKFHAEVVGTVEGDMPIVIVLDDPTGEGICMSRADARKMCAALLVAIHQAEEDA